MEPIRLKKLSWVNKFLENEGQVGQMVNEIIERFEGALFEELLKAETIKQVVSKPQIFELRIHLTGIFFRFLGPKSTGCIILLHAFKKKTNKIPPRELNIAVKRAKELGYS